MLSTFLQECLMLSLLAATTAGKAILDVYHGHIDVTYKNDRTPLTLADERAHTIITNHLSSKVFGKRPVLSEEGRDIPYDERRMWEYFWLVDPLDGTKEFIKRRAEFTVNIALVNKKRPILGVVSVPARGFLYFAAEGLGSYKLEDIEAVPRMLSHQKRTDKGDDGPIRRIVDSATRLPLSQPRQVSEKRLTVVGSRSHGSKALEAFLKAVEQKYHVDFTPAGSALKFGLVAEGTAQLYPRLSPTMEWDTAAGQCVIEQSGGLVLRLSDRVPPVYNKKDLRNPEFFCTGKDFSHLSHLFEST